MAYEVKGDLTVTGLGEVDGGSSSGGGGSSVPIPFVTAKTIGAHVDNISTAVTGTGVVVAAQYSDGMEMTVGGAAKAAGRVYCNGRKFYASGNEIVMNGANLPWYQWNEFGSNSFDITKWREEFERLQLAGINAVRVWIVCSSENQGVTLDLAGQTLPPPPKFWQDCDALMALAAEFKIYVMAVLMSFDCYDWNNPYSDRWHIMLGSLSGVQSHIANFVLPFAQRYQDNIYLWAIDLCNEFDNSYDNMSYATPRRRVCTPVGSGSQYFDFDFRLSDFVVGMQLTVAGVNCGTVLARVSDTRLQATNGFAGASQAYTAGGGGSNWGFNVQSWSIFPRYAAYAAQAIHRAGCQALVTVGNASLKWMSPLNEGGDTLSDTALSAITGDQTSRLDFHAPHHYSWGEAWFSPFESPIVLGLSAKPAVLAEFSANPQECNAMGMIGWRRDTFLPTRSNKWFLRRVLAGGGYELWETDGNGRTGMDNPFETYSAEPFPGTTMADGTIVWSKVMSGNTWKANTAYSWGAVVLADTDGTNGKGRLYHNMQAGTSGSGVGPAGTQEYDYPAWEALTDYALGDKVRNSGRFYQCTVAGTSGNSGGPTGWNPSADGGVTWQHLGVETTLNDGTCIWELKRDPFDTMEEIITAQRANGWAGWMPWAANRIDFNGALYVDRYPGRGVIQAWAANTSYAADATVFNDGYKRYRLLNGPATSGSSGGPTGQGSAISDGACSWKYIETIASNLLNESGQAFLDFATTYPGLLTPAETLPTDLNAGSVVRQSRHRTIYIPGVDSVVVLTSQFGEGLDGVSQRVGWFDTTDGIFLQRSGGVDSIVIRRKGADTVVPRAEWNVDVLDGDGASGVEVDLENVNTLVISVGWLHGGRNRVGFMVDGSVFWAHEIFVSGLLLPTTPANPNLPLRWEISCSGDVTEVRSLSSFVGYAARPPVSLSQRSVSYTRQNSTITLNASVTSGFCGLRPSLAGTKVGFLRPKRIFILDSGGVKTNTYQQRYRWQLALNPDYSGYSPTWTELTSIAEITSSVQTDYNTGIILAKGYFRGDTADVILDNMPWLGFNADGSVDYVVFSITNLGTTTSYLWGGLEWEERL